MADAALKVLSEIHETDDVTQKWLDVSKRCFDPWALYQQQRYKSPAYAFLWLYRSCHTHLPTQYLATPISASVASSSPLSPRMITKYAQPCAVPVKDAVAASTNASAATAGKSSLRTLIVLVERPFFVAEEKYDLERFAWRLLLLLPVLVPNALKRVPGGRGRGLWPGRSLSRKPMIAEPMS